MLQEREIQGVSELVSGHFKVVQNVSEELSEVFTGFTDFQMSFMNISRGYRGPSRRFKALP